jgi:hypothetical protein
MTFCFMRNWVDLGPVVQCLVNQKIFWLPTNFLVTGFSVNFRPLTVVKLNKILTNRRGLG